MTQSAAGNCCNICTQLYSILFRTTLPSPLSVLIRTKSSQKNIILPTSTVLSHFVSRPWWIEAAIQFPLAAQMMLRHLVGLLCEWCEDDGDHWCSLLPQLPHLTTHHNHNISTNCYPIKHDFHGHCNVN